MDEDEDGDTGEHVENATKNPDTIESDDDDDDADGEDDNAAAEKDNADGEDNDAAGEVDLNPLNPNDPPTPPPAQPRTYSSRKKRARDKTVLTEDEPSSPGSHLFLSLLLLSLRSSFPSQTKIPLPHRS
jgi:hypothetical protein